MKGGVNIWVALRDTQDPHPAWMHAKAAYAEKDMPRSILNPHEERDVLGKEVRKRAVAAAAASKAKVAATLGSSSKPAKVFDISVNTGGKAAAAPVACSTRARRPQSAIALAIEAEALAEANELGVAAL
jgi:hypothetical protein